MRKLSEFELKLQQHLDHGPTPHFYQLWQQCDQGQIVGFYHQSVEVCWGNSPALGWTYAVEKDGELSYIRETDIKGAVPCSASPESIGDILVAANQLIDLLDNTELVHLPVDEAKEIRWRQLQLGNAISRFAKEV